MENKLTPMPDDISFQEVRQFLETQTGATAEIAVAAVSSTLDLVAQTAANPTGIPESEPLDESQITMAQVDEALEHLAGGDLGRVKAMRLIFEQACAGILRAKDMLADIHVALLEQEVAGAPPKTRVYVVVAKITGIEKPLIIEAKAVDVVEALHKAEPEIGRVLAQWKVPPESCRIISVHRLGDDQKAVANVLTTLARAFNEGVGPHVKVDVNAGVMPPDYFFVRVGDAKLHIRREAGAVNVWVVDGDGEKVW